MSLTNADRSSRVEFCSRALGLARGLGGIGLHRATARTTSAAAGSPAPRRTAGFRAVADSSLIGVVLGPVAHHDPAIGHVDFVAVDPDRWRQGIGRTLLGRAEQALAGLAAREVRLASDRRAARGPASTRTSTNSHSCRTIGTGHRAPSIAYNMVRSDKVRQRDIPPHNPN